VREQYEQRLAGGGAIFLALLIAMPFFIETVDTGHGAVATRFGKVTGAQLDEAFYFVNPILSWDHYNLLNRTADFKNIQVPASDEMKASMDISIQYSIAESSIVTMRQETGVENRAVDVHFIPHTKRALRAAGRAATRVEDFFEEAKIEEYQATALATLQDKLGPLGFDVTEVLVRNVSLPELITNAIATKKQREQEVEEQKAKLAKQKLIAQEAVQLATADRDAAVLEAEAVEIRAAAEATKIGLVQTQLAKSPAFIEYVKAQRWDGMLPRFTGGGAVPFINIDAAGN